ncbi:alanine racemase [Zunongwangia profunda SM-A87]|uniref:Pyridoxal phosphate homeostasis protein n=1 Tax=Zunongwangia profunda (strain DSM 18752 / CCTCC AB 206139 / SM-A87) TaxID=655815 RepID=D5BID5_ZUNPS|nr:YggS family pyridoxal phosphate-dependent enzyme [Zunongwangia profunda]ADF53548.1 alanine racemase [Zunongwangia profunda SM-A87]|tara:strand:- start:152 stop:811 length:660 start_codon:yes stop_codon:yes gene_type:complete
MNIAENIKKYRDQLPDTVDLVAISKTKPNEDLMEAYEVGQRIFGENKIQEMTDKWEALPKDIEWHMVGHVQRNKVKYMAPYVGLIHAVDSLKLLKEINKQAKKHDRVIRCLLQIKIAEEDSKFGISAGEAEEILQSETYKTFENVAVVGLMGMATHTDNDEKVAEEFDYLHSVFKDFRVKYPAIKELSMGMSGDYKIAVKHGSTMVRIGSSIFGARNYN